MTISPLLYLFHFSDPIIKYRRQLPYVPISCLTEVVQQITYHKGNLRKFLHDGFNWYRYFI